MTGPVRYHAGAFPPASIRWEELIPFIGPASAALARYDGTLAAVPDPSVLLSPLVTQEAVLSSRIEGTQATMGEVLEFEADASPANLPEARREDIQEVLNYRRAMRHAEARLADLPLSLRLIKEVHAVLLEGVRGQTRAPGELRRIPNWIGPPDSPIEQARFVPISADQLPAALSTWERYLHGEQPDQLVQLGIVHAEFEALHPFLDGNGRLGRMLVPLFLWQKGLIRQPMFYVSAYFEANREAYYEHLLAVSRDGNWTGWCRFFLEAVRAQAEDNQRKATSILALYGELKPKVVELTRSQYAIHALDWMFERPIFRSTDFMAAARIPGPTARRILTVLKTDGILREIVTASGRRPAVYTFSALLNVAEGKEVF